MIEYDPTKKIEKSWKWRKKWKLYERIIDSNNLNDAKEKKRNKFSGTKMTLDGNV